MTDPVDISEGVGLGSTLVPQSLYLDQLALRLKKIITSVDTVPLLNSGIEIYPNPAKDKIIIKLINPIYSLDKFIIMDINGQIFQDIDFKNNLELEIKTESLNSGVYFLKSKNAVQKFVIEK